MFEYIGNRDVHSAWYHPHTCHEPCLYYKNGCTPQYDWFDDYRETQTEPRTNLWTKLGTWIQGTGLKTYYNYYGAYLATASGKFFYTNEVGASLTFDTYRNTGQLFGMINITMDDISGVININGRNISGIDMSFTNYYYMNNYYQPTIDIYIAVNSGMSQVYWTRPWGYNWWNYGYGYLQTNKEGYNASSTVDANNLTITVVNAGTGYVRINGCYNLNPAIPGKFKHDKTYVDNYDSSRCQDVPQIYCNACDAGKLCDNVSVTISNIPAAVPAEDYYSSWQRATASDPRVYFYGNSSYFGNCHVVRCSYPYDRYITGYYQYAQEAWIEDGCCIPHPYFEMAGEKRPGWGTTAVYGESVGGTITREYWRTYSLGACIYASGDTASVTPSSPTSIDIKFWLEAATGVGTWSVGPDIYAISPALVTLCPEEGRLGLPHFLSSTDDNTIEVDYGGGGDVSLETNGFSVTINFPDPVIQPRTGPITYCGHSYSFDNIYQGSECYQYSAFIGGYVQPYLNVTGIYGTIYGPYNQMTQQTYTFTIYTTDGTTLQASTGWITEPHFIVGYCKIGHLFVVANDCNSCEGAPVMGYPDTPPTEDDFIVTVVQSWSTWDVRTHTDMNLWDCDKFNGTFILPKTEACLYEDSIDLSDKSFYFDYANPLPPYDSYSSYSCISSSWVRFRLGFNYYPGYYNGWNNYYNPYYYYYGGYNYYSYYWLYWQNGNYGYFFPSINETVDDLLFFNQAARLQCNIYKDTNLYGYNTSTYDGYFVSGAYPVYYFTYYRDVAVCRGFIDYNNPGSLPTLSVNDSTDELTIGPFIYSAAGPGGSVCVIKPDGLTVKYQPVTTKTPAGISTPFYGYICGHTDDDYKTGGCSGVYTVFFGMSTSGTIDFGNYGTTFSYNYMGIPFNYNGGVYNWYMGGYFAGNTVGALSFILQPGETDYNTRVQDYMCYRMNNPQRQMLSWPNYKNLDVNTIFFGSGVGNGMLLDTNIYLWEGTKYIIPDTIINTSTWVDATYYFYTKTGEIKWYKSQCPKSSGFYLGMQTYTHTFSRSPTFTDLDFIYPYTDATKSTFFNSPTVASAIYDTSTHILTLSGIGTDYFDFYATGTSPSSLTYKRYKLYNFSAYSPANDTYIHYYINKNGVFSIDTANTINPSWTPTEGIIIGTVITNGLGLHTFNDRRTEPSDTRHGLYLFNFCPENSMTSSIGTDPMTYQFQYRDPTPTIPWRSEVWFNGTCSYKTGMQTVSYYPIETGFFNMYYNSGGTLVVDHSPVNDRNGITLCTFEVRKNMSITDIGYYYGSILGTSSSPYFGYYYYGYYGYWYSYGWYKNPEDVCGALDCNNLVDFPLKPLQFSNWCNTAVSGSVPRWSDSDFICDMGESECKISSI